MRRLFLFIFLIFFSLTSCGGGVPGSTDESQSESAPEPFILYYLSNRALDGSDASIDANNIWKININGETEPITRFKSKGIRFNNLLFSPDGRKVLMLVSLDLAGEDKSGPENIWILDKENNELTPVTKTENINYKIATWSKDGSKIYFLANQKLTGLDEPHEFSTYNLWEVDADGSNLRPRTTFPDDEDWSSDLVLSPDGRYFLFKSFEGVPSIFGDTTLWILDLNGFGFEEIAFFENATMYDMQWTPDGEKIIFRSNQHIDGSQGSTFRNPSNLWIMGQYGANPEPITKFKSASIGDFKISPDGKRILVNGSIGLDGSDEEGFLGNLFVLDVNGTNLSPLTRYLDTLLSLSGAVWAPDGEKIALESEGEFDGSDNPNANSKSNIWIINSDGSVFKPLTNLISASAGNPIWIP